MLVDVALLTDRGIVFCYIPQPTLEKFRAMAVAAKPDQNVFAIIEIGEYKRYEVTLENILVAHMGNRSA